jgi:C1A family cysteine protease
VLDSKSREILMKNGINGVIPDKKDERDYIFSAKVSAELPSKVDLRPYSGEIENQLMTGSCVANATCSALELMYRKEHDNDIDLSRMYVYYWAREPYPNLKEVDGGAYMRDGFKVCNQRGVPLEEYWDFIESKVNERPSGIADEQAPDNKAIRYERVPNDSIDGIKAALNDGFPVIFGTWLTEEFYYISGPIENQNYRGRLGYTDVIGGHAMNIVGYDDDMNGGSLIVENSWSTAWGDNGYCAFPYEVFTNDGMDCWVCTEFKTDLLQPEPIPDPEPVDPEEYEPEDIFEDINHWFHKMLRKVINMIIEMPSLSEVWQNMLNVLRALWVKFKGDI